MAHPFKYDYDCVDCGLACGIEAATPEILEEGKQHMGDRCVECASAFRKAELKAMKDLLTLPAS